MDRFHIRANLLPKAKKGFSNLWGDEVYDRVQETFMRNFPDPRSGFEYSGGYIFLPVNNALLKNSEKTFDPKKKEMKYKVLEKAICPEQLQAAKEVLAQEYKIHLMPQGEYVLSILNEVLEILQRDKKLLGRIQLIKIRGLATMEHRFPTEEFSETEADWPTIVIYPQAGKDAAQFVLAKLYEHLQPYAVLGEKRTLRYNRRITDLLYYAQGDASMKYQYIQMQKQIGKDPQQNDWYDPDFVHFKGNYKLHLPIQQDVPVNELAAPIRNAAAKILRDPAMDTNS
ncbi:MAG: hypothetical protein Greene041619_889 [Candidatus Peregrinibacteria bacterium Greene0416_19]|nr:MAG: hypothetical protein Greene041619_889 [Candidatus Peregrinibacteria bacterium Greene0416_19]